MTRFQCGYGTPGSWDAVAKFRSGAAYLGGRTDLVDLMRLGVAAPDHLVDVSRLPLQDSTVSGGGLRIGAAVRNSDLGAHPLVRRLYRCWPGSC